MLLFVYSVLQGSCLHGEDKLGRREVGREGGRWEEPGKLTSAVRRVIGWRRGEGCVLITMERLDLISGAILGWLIGSP